MKINIEGKVGNIYWELSPRIQERIDEITGGNEIAKQYIYGILSNMVQAICHLCYGNLYFDSKNMEIAFDNLSDALRKEASDNIKRAQDIEK